MQTVSDFFAFMGAHQDALISTLGYVVAGCVAGAHASSAAAGLLDTFAKGHAGKSTAHAQGPVVGVLFGISAVLNQAAAVMSKALPSKLAPK